MKHETSMFLRDLSAMSTSQRNTTHMMFSVVVLFGSIWSICLLYHLAKSCAHLKSCETLQVLQEISCAKVPFIGTGSQLEDVCQFPWNPHSFQQQNSRSCMVWRISSVFSASLRSVSGSVHLFLEWTNFLNKVMVLPQFCVESFFGAKGGGFNRYYPNKLHITNSFHFPSDWMKSNLAATSSDPEKQSWHTFSDLREESCEFLLRKKKSCLQVRSKTLVTPIWRKLAQVRFL